MKTQEQNNRKLSPVFMQRQQQQRDRRLNVDNSNSNVVLLFWFTLFISLLVSFIISNYSPQAFIIKQNSTEFVQTSHQNCTNPIAFYNKKLYCKNISIENPILGLLLKDLSNWNQFAQINLLIIPKNQHIDNINFNSIAFADLYSLIRKHLDGQKLISIQNVNINTNSLKYQQLTLLNSSILKGFSYNFGFYRQFKSKDAVFIIKFTNIQNINLQQFDLVAQAFLVNQKYTIFLCFFRGFFAILMIVLRIYYCHKNKIQIFKSQFQQVIVYMISWSIIFFNNPCYFVFYLLELQTLYQICESFVFHHLVFLSISLLYMINYIHKKNNIKYILNIKIKNQKIVILIISIVYFIVAFIGYFLYYKQPLIVNQRYKQLKIITTIIFIIFVTILALGYINILINWDNIIWRDQFYLLFNFFFILLLLLFNFGSSINIYDQTSQKFQIFYFSMNIYVIYLQYMYSYAQKNNNKQFQLNEQHQNAQIFTPYNNFNLQQDIQVQVQSDINFEDQDKQKPLESIDVIKIINKQQNDNI